MSANVDTPQTRLVKYAINLVLTGAPRDCNSLYRQRAFHDDVARFNNQYAVLDFEYAKRDVLYRYVNSRVLGKAPVDYLEFGVASGESMRSWAAINKRPESRFFGFDSFEGLPEDWHQDAPKGAFSTNGVTPNIEDERVSFIKGLFQDTVADFSMNFTPQNKLVLHMDADLYSSTLYVLMNLDRHIKSGCVILFDEFTARSYTDEYAALKDYCSACGKDYRLLATRRDFVKLAIEIV